MAQKTINYAAIPRVTTINVGGQQVPMLDPESVSNAIYLLWQNLYALSGRGANGAAFQGPIDAGGNTVGNASNSSNPPAAELVTRGYADANYGASAMRSALGATGSQPLLTDFAAPHVRKTLDYVDNGQNNSSVSTLGVTGGMINRWGLTGSGGGQGAQQSGQNLLFNPTGRLGLNGWTSTGGFQSSTETSGFASRFMCNTAGVFVLYQEFSIPAPNQYTISSWLEIDNFFSGQSIGVDLYDVTAANLIASAYYSSAGQYRASATGNLTNTSHVYAARLYSSSTGAAGAYWYLPILNMGSTPSSWNDGLTAGAVGNTHNPAGGYGTDGILDGINTRRRITFGLPYVNNVGSWSKLGTFTAMTGLSTPIDIEIRGKANGVGHSLAEIRLISGEPDFNSFNLSGYWARLGDASTQLITGVKAVCTDDPTHGNGYVWDIYANLETFSDSSFCEVLMNAGSWVTSATLTSDPGTGPNILVVGGGNLYLDSNSNLNAPLNNSVQQFDPSNTLRGMFLLGHNNADNVGNGSTYGLPLIDYLQSGVPYNFKGAWSAGTYNAGDEVTNDGNYWLATALTTQTPNSSATQWQMVGPLNTDSVASGLSNFFVNNGPGVGGLSNVSGSGGSAVATTGSVQSQAITGQFTQNTTVYRNITSSGTAISVSGFTVPSGATGVEVSINGAIASTNSTAVGWGIQLVNASSTVLFTWAYQAFGGDVGSSVYRPFSFSYIDATGSTGYSWVITTNTGGTVSLIPIVMAAKVMKR